MSLKPHIALNATAKDRFLREAKAAAAIEDDHIIPIFQVGEANGVPFLCMPMLKGEALDERLKKASTLPPHAVLRIGREIALGLAAAHERGLIHRDIKPGNIWLEETRNTDRGVRNEKSSPGRSPLVLKKAKLPRPQ